MKYIDVYHHKCMVKSANARRGGHPWTYKKNKSLAQAPHS